MGRAGFVSWEGTTCLSALICCKITSDRFHRCCSSTWAVDAYTTCLHYMSDLKTRRWCCACERHGKVRVVAGQSASASVRWQRQPISHQNVPFPLQLRARVRRALMLGRLIGGWGLLSSASSYAASLFKPLPLPQRDRNVVFAISIVGTSVNLACACPCKAACASVSLLCLRSRSRRVAFDKATTHTFTRSRHSCLPLDPVH